jgi:hypothetical protein
MIFYQSSNSVAPIQQLAKPQIVSQPQTMQPVSNVDLLFSLHEPAVSLAPNPVQQMSSLNATSNVDLLNDLSTIAPIKPMQFPPMQQAVQPSTLLMSNSFTMPNINALYQQQQHQQQQFPQQTMTNPMNQVGQIKSYRV